MENEQATEIFFKYLRLSTPPVALKMCTSEDEVPAEVVELAEERQEARASKDFGKSDKLRDEIAEKGYTVEDAAGGFTLKKVL